MSFSGLLISEIFHSLQGETTLSGLPFAFIRLTGCNLRCSYCDSAYAFKGGRKMEISEILAEIEPYRVQHALLTGGEPLLQRNSIELMHALHDKGYSVSVETHGEVSIERVPSFVRIVMDAKTPSSGMCRGGFQKNLKHLKPGDELKFVIGSEEDYAWARQNVQAISSDVTILFSPVIQATGSPGGAPSMDAQWLAERILEDRLPVRFQLQIHKFIWGKDTRGV